MATQPDISIELPCIEIDPLGSLPQIPLLGGAQVNAFVDITGGTPTSCKLMLRSANHPWIWSSLSAGAYMSP